MTYEETARFLNGALNYWPTLFRGNDPEAMTQAWAVALADIPYAACARGVVKLAQTMKFPPSIAEISPAQKTWIAALRKAGYAVEVCKGWEAAAAVIMDYLEGRYRPVYQG